MLVIGRDPASDVPLPHPKISRRHPDSPIRNRREARRPPRVRRRVDRSIVRRIAPASPARISLPPVRTARKKVGRAFSGLFA
jgi:hypothetical protein